MSSHAPRGHAAASCPINSDLTDLLLKGSAALLAPLLIHSPRDRAYHLPCEGETKAEGSLRQMFQIQIPALMLTSMEHGQVTAYTPSHSFLLCDVGILTPSAEV